MKHMDEFLQRSYCMYIHIYTFKVVFNISWQTLPTVGVMGATFSTGFPPNKVFPPGPPSQYIFPKLSAHLYGFGLYNFSLCIHLVVCAALFTTVSESFVLGSDKLYRFPTAVLRRNEREPMTDDPLCHRTQTSWGLSTLKTFKLIYFFRT